MEKPINQMRLELLAISVNERFARAAVSAFCVQAGPSLDEITDIKTAVSEAVTNCVVHAYPKKPGLITISARLFSWGLELEITDTGIGIKDIPSALEPFFTTKPTAERSGMGFTVMQSFMDSLEVTPNPAGGTSVKLTKRFSASFEAMGA